MSPSPSGSSPLPEPPSGPSPTTLHFPLPHSSPWTLCACLFSIGLSTAEVGPEVLPPMLGILLLSLILGAWNFGTRSGLGVRTVGINRSCCQDWSWAGRRGQVEVAQGSHREHMEGGVAMAERSRVQHHRTGRGRKGPGRTCAEEPRS